VDVTRSIAVCGLRTECGLPENQSRIELAIASAAAAGASLAILPELVTSGYTTDRAQLLDCRRDIAAATASIREFAHQHRIAVIAGTARFEDAAIYNSAIAVEATGGLLGCYDKLHLFAGEIDAFTPGRRGLMTFAIAGLSVGVMICYDLRFVEAMRFLALRGAHVIAVPTAWTPGFDQPPGHEPFITQVVGAAVQANLNQLYVACAGMAGAEDSGHARLLGRSVIIDPFGNAAAGPAPEFGAVTLCATVDPDVQNLARHRGSNIDPLAQRRSDVYGDLNALS
jgi:N-carbamoylputrescine amidase